jgi:O-antigen/teichoic acid export membrane protein
VGLAVYAFAFFLTGFGALFGPGLFRLRPAFAWPGLATFREHFKKGGPVFLASLFAALALMFPLALLEQTHPSDEVAWMTTAFRIFVLLDVLAKAVYSVILPDLSRAAEVLLGVPILVLFFLSPLVMEMFGEGFSGGTPVLQALLVSGLVSLLLGPAHQLLLMVGKTRSMAFFSGIYFAIVGLLAWFFVPEYGAFALAIVLAIVLGIGLIVEKVLYLVCAVQAGRRHERGGGHE